MCHIFQLLWMPCNGWKVHCGKNAWQTNFSKKTMVLQVLHTANISRIRFQVSKPYYMHKWELDVLSGKDIIESNIKKSAAFVWGACTNQYPTLLHIFLIKCGCLQSWILDDTSLYRCCFRLLITYKSRSGWCLKTCSLLDDPTMISTREATLYILIHPSNGYSWGPKSWEHKIIPAWTDGPIGLTSRTPCLRSSKAHNETPYPAKTLPVHNPLCLDPNTPFLRMPPLVKSQLLAIDMSCFHSIPIWLFLIFIT